MKNVFVKRVLVFGLTILFLNSCSSQKPVYKSLWQESDFTTINIKELQKPFRFCDKNSKLQYDVTNDEKNMYICIKATDEQFQMKIIRAGMQINIDTIGKGAPQICIAYPIYAGKEKPQMPANFKQTQEKNDKNPMKIQFLSEHKEMQLSGFKSPINGLVPLKNNYGIFVNIVWDSLNIMYYKAIIPFNTFFKENMALSDSMKILNLSFVVNAMQIPGNKMGEPPEKGEKPEGGNMQGGGRGNKMGNGGPPSDKGEGMQEDNFLSKKNVIKIKIAPAVNNKSSNIY